MQSNDVHTVQKLPSSNPRRRAADQFKRKIYIILIAGKRAIDK